MNISPLNILRLATRRLLGLCALFACAFLPLHAASLDDLTYTTTDGKVTITKCDRAAAGELLIPDTIEGNPVTSIGAVAFRRCSSLTSITIPDGVTSIGSRALEDCNSLMEVVLLGLAPVVEEGALKSAADGVIAFATTEFIESYGGDGASWEGLIVREISPPVLNLESFYESAPNQSLVIDALNFPINYLGTSYQWWFNGFPVSEELGGKSPKITLNGSPDSYGVWSVTATNFLGEATAEFEYLEFVDTDSDGLSDYREQNLTETNFELADTDGDGLNDYQELIVFETDPTDSDSDDDGYLDGQEQTEGTDPNQAESYPQRTLTVGTVENGSVKGVGIFAFGTDATLEAIPDKGYVFQGWSGVIGVSGVSACLQSLQFALDSGVNILNAIDVVLGKEIRMSGDVNHPDGSEFLRQNYDAKTICAAVAQSSYGMVFTTVMTSDRSIEAVFTKDEADPDGDGLSNYQELVLYETDPADSDSDDDGYLDGQEQTEGTDPNDSQSFPERKPIELRIEKLNAPSLVIFAYWTGEVGKTYRIEYAANFQNWNILDSGIKGTGLEQSRALPGPKGYVRVAEE